MTIAKRVIIAILLGALVVPGYVQAQEAVRVKILPFGIYARQGHENLADKIPQEIGRHLRAEGVDVRSGDSGLSDSQDPNQMTLDSLRALGRDLEVDYIVWGSFSKIGNRFSVDAKVAAAYVPTPAESIFVEGAGMETLSAQIGALSAEVAAKVLGKQTVASIDVAGSKRIEKDAILRVIKTGSGDMYSAKSLAEDVRAIFKMGYFDDIRVEAQDSPKGKEITFTVKEKATVRQVSFKGNRAFDNDEMLESVDISRGSILNLVKVEENVRRIEDMYKEKNYHNVKVVYNVKDRKDNEADVEFEIDEGGKVLIEEIQFEGNKAYSDKEIKKIMKTSERGFFSWITSSGELDRENLKQDEARILAFYHNSGYVQAKVSGAEVDITKEGIIVKIKIDEGAQFKVGAVDVVALAPGDQLIKEKTELLESLSLGKEEVFSREVVRQDVMVLTDLYSDEGYAYADIYPKTEKDLENRVVKTTYVVDKGPLVYFERIIIAGNTKTRDKVIRREIPVDEQGLYKGSGVKRGVRNLFRLDYFEDVKVDTMKGSADDKMVLRIGVKEKPTGSFSFGGGYSSVDDAFAMASISQRNLFGRGQTLKLEGQVGGSTTKYNLSFTEPWLFDTRLSFGVDIYKWSKEYDTYDRESTGAGLRFGFPLIDYTRLYLSYYYDISDIENVEEFAADSIQDMEGENTKSSVSASIVRDSRDRAFNPTQGSHNRITLEYAGDPLGGDIAYTKYTGESGWYFPIFWRFVGYVHGEAGYIRKNSGGILPIYERFYLGGINSLRGFEWEELSPADEDGALIGGDKFVQFNAELIFPLVDKAGLMGVAFYDTGNEWDNDYSVDLGNLRESAGAGVRWYSPIGPIRLERAFILNPEQSEPDNGRWEFTMGGAF